MARMSIPLVGLLVFCTLMVSVAAFELETPEYTVVHEDDDYEVRLYNETVWAVAEVEDLSFSVATVLGFHRLFSYIQGANMNWSRITMTAPVLTGIVPSDGPFCSSAFAVRFYLPACFHEAPPTPLPELEITFERWEKQTIAVRKFSGYAQDSNVAQEAEKLAIALSNSAYVEDATYPIQGEDSYAIAQYDSPFKFWKRVNEVWVNIRLPGFKASSEEKVPLHMVTEEDVA
ncbi:unnamed protein product [Calypogeia fissa]